MNQGTNQILFALLRSAIGGAKLTDDEKALYSEDALPELITISQKHDIVHLLALGLKQNGLSSKDHHEIEESVFKAVYRYERLNAEKENLCKVLESARIPFLPLKGAVLRRYYPKAWMRTSCDIDILVREEDAEQAAALLADSCGYVYGKPGSVHDISLFAPNSTHIELHYHLVEDGVANASSAVLKSVWETALVRDGYRYWYEMPDEMFYFYHIAHMAKHFENGGCGIRPLMDLWILDSLEGADQSRRNDLLEQGKLLKFAEAARKLSKVWFEGAKTDPISQQMEDYILTGGAYGTTTTSAVAKAAKGDGKIRSFMNMMFLPRVNLEVLYPNLRRFPILLPFYQVKRWFRVLKKDKRDKVKRLTAARNAVTPEEAVSATALLEKLGLLE